MEIMNIYSELKSIRHPKKKITKTEKTSLLKVKTFEFLKLFLFFNLYKAII
jgi:hypothetical protein